MEENEETEAPQMFKTFTTWMDSWIGSRHSHNDYYLKIIDDQINTYCNLHKLRVVKADYSLVYKNGQIGKCEHNWDRTTIVMVGVSFEPI